MDLFSKLVEVYKDYRTRIESIDGRDYFVIVNPSWDENIRVSEEDGIVFFFSNQHAHFDYCDDIDENIDCLIEYINAFLHEKQVSIEFFQGDTDLFGGSRRLDDLDMSSGKSLLRNFTDDNKSLYKIIYKQLKGLNCRCSIRAWDSTYNKDIDFVI